MDLQHLRVGTLDWAYYEAGQGPLVLCLHGFPDAAHSFDELLPVLAGAGYRAVAPFLPGYFPTGLAPADDYAIPSLARQVLALIDALSPDQEAILIGHDWGGFIAYTAANICPQRIAKLTVLGVPHMGASQFSVEQLRKSWYVWFFQLPGLPEWRVSRKNFAFIDRLYAAWSPSWPADQWRLEPVKRALAAPDGLHAALAFYRGMIRGNNASNLALMKAKTSVPSLWLAGEEDGSVDIHQFDKLEQAFTGPFKQVTVPGAGHFLHREKPEIVHQHVLAFLKENLTDD